jgi:hypothetical protein
LAATEEACSSDSISRIIRVGAFRSTAKPPIFEGGTRRTLSLGKFEFRNFLCDPCAFLWLILWLQPVSAAKVSGLELFYDVFGKRPIARGLWKCDLVHLFKGRQFG